MQILQSLDRFALAARRLPGKRWAAYSLVSLSRATRSMCRTFHVLFVLGALGFVASLASAEQPFGNGLLTELLDRGVRIGDESVPLHAPKASPELSEEKLSLAQQSLAGSRGWQSFIRDSVVAPVHIELEYITDQEGRRIGIRSHFAFVVHTDVARLRDDRSMRELFEGAAEASNKEGFRSEAIDPHQLVDLGIEADDNASFGWLETILLNKVMVSGVLRSERFDNGDYDAIAWKLDERFTGREPPHPRYRNQWRELRRDELGRKILGPAVPYAGAAGYLFVSPVEGVDGTSLIEAEIVLHEPQGWFSGSNLLRSKLPLMIQESARKLRRALR